MQYETLADVLEAHRPGCSCPGVGRWADHVVEEITKAGFFVGRVAPPRQCTASTRSGGRCRLTALEGTDKCKLHTVELLCGVETGRGPCRLVTGGGPCELHGGDREARIAYTRGRV